MISGYFALSRTFLFISASRFLFPLSPLVASAINCPLASPVLGLNTISPDFSRKVPSTSCMVVPRAQLIRVFAGSNFNSLCCARQRRNQSKQGRTREPSGTAHEYLGCFRFISPCRGAVD